MFDRMEPQSTKLLKHPFGMAEGANGGREGMAFINEYIPEADVKKYGIEEIDKRFIVGGTRARDWTIDREREIYLRNVANGREEIRYQSTWTLYWKGELITLVLHLLGGAGKRGEPGWSHWKLHHIYIPSYLEDCRDEILADLKDALTAYKDGGVFSSNTTYSVTLDV